MHGRMARWSTTFRTRLLLLLALILDARKDGALEHTFRTRLLLQLSKWCELTAVTCPDIYPHHLDSCIYAILREQPYLVQRVECF